jgi:hypothetical protein
MQVEVKWLAHVNRTPVVDVNACDNGAGRIFRLCSFSGMLDESCSGDYDVFNLNEALDFAVATVREAGAVPRDYYQNGVTVSYKGEIELITEADHASEALILNRIRTAYPDCAILSEESGASANSSPYVWIADPLDDTTNFAHGLPIFSVTLAWKLYRASCYLLPPQPLPDHGRS